VSNGQHRADAVHSWLRNPPRLAHRSHFPWRLVIAASAILIITVVMMLVLDTGSIMTTARRVMRLD
jgi:hypothetical protein